jgi:inhibitor of cysteine peptidase
MLGRHIRPAALLWLVFAGLAAGGLAGCGGSDRTTTTAPMQTGAVPGAVIVTQSDSGKTVPLKVGNTLIVRLESNPSTGYGWAPSGTVPDCLTQQGQGTFETGSSGLVGAPGTQSLAFFAAQSGSGTLTLAYVRPWETTQPAKTFTIQVEVAP